MTSGTCAPLTTATLPTSWIRTRETDLAMRFLLIALLIVALAASGRPFKTAAEVSPQSPAPTPDHLVYDDWDDCTATETDKFCRRLGFIPPWEQPPTPEQRKSRPQRVTISTRGPGFDGETTMEHRIADADLIIMGRLATVANTVAEYDFEGRTGYTGALRFTFNVDEVLSRPRASRRRNDSPRSSVRSTSSRPVPRRLPSPRTC